MRPTRVLALVALAAATAACGSDDDPSGDATRTIEIEMQDNTYVPDTIEVADGEAVRLVFTNLGDVAHDAYIGDEAAQHEHEAEMNGNGGGHHMGGDSDALSVEPGDTAELTHTFTAGDEVLIGCHEPGHYESGMRLSVDVR